MGQNLPLFTTMTVENKVFRELLEQLTVNSSFSFYENFFGWVWKLLASIREVGAFETGKAVFYAAAEGVAKEKG